MVDMVPISSIEEAGKRLRVKHLIVVPLAVLPAAVVESLPDLILGAALKSGPGDAHVVVCVSAVRGEADFGPEVRFHTLVIPVPRAVLRSDFEMSITSASRRGERRITCDLDLLYA
jgi:hypothetical protein